MSTTDPTFTDDGFDILAGTEPPTAEEALSLEDTLATPTLLDSQQLPPAALGRAPAIDFAAQAFVPNTAGGPLMIYGLDTLAQWVEKCLRTRRGENPACDPDFGVDKLFTDLLDGSGYDESAAAEFQGIVERGLSVHPDIDSIEEWAITYIEGDDAAQIQFTVIPVAEGQDPLTVDVALPATGATSA